MTPRLSWSNMVNSMKEPLLWTAAGVLSFVGFLFLTFPFQALQARILTELTRATGWDIRAAEWSVEWPLGVTWRDLMVSKPSAASFPIESMTMKVDLWAQLAGRRTVDALMHFPGSPQPGAARATGTVTASSWSFQGPTTVKAHLQQIELPSFLKPLVTKGLLRADVNQAWIGNPDGSVLFKGDGMWKAEVADLTLEQIPAGPSRIPSLTFNRVMLTVACHNDHCDVKDFNGEGPDGSVSGQGRLRLMQPIQQTELELSITVQAGAGWAQKSAGLALPPLPPGASLTFKLVGTVANPRLSV